LAQQTRHASREISVPGRVLFLQGVAVVNFSKAPFANENLAKGGAEL
jgi:hypothetical protein